tara:strand:- start:9533 stop:10168 length:636 start_codon:yes stop_codon:yes gene_type:complete
MHTDSPQETPLHKEDEHQVSPESEKASIKNLIFFALIVVAIVVPIRTYIAKPFIVSGTSMYPAFNTWHYLIIDQLQYRFNEPQRGDVITFRFAQNKSQFLIKRIIGLPNETLYLKGTTVTVVNDAYPDGVILDEYYVKEENQKESDMVVNLGDNEYFVMGDNRRVSADSRYWGPLERERIVGRAYIRIFPLGAFGTNPGSVSYTYRIDEEE